VVEENVREVVLVATRPENGGSGAFVLNIESGEVNLDHLGAYRRMKPDALKSLAGCLYKVAESAEEAIKRYKKKTV
jgi:hypothetical protein